MDLYDKMISSRIPSGICGDYLSKMILNRESSSSDRLKDYNFLLNEIGMKPGHAKRFIKNCSSIFFNSVYKIGNNHK